MKQVYNKKYKLARILVMPLIANDQSNLSASDMRGGVE